ncbi:MAG TPA: Calx-beta domain-containing protein [Pyrinomonadaceae bacterium]|nr:Calx-beta domain-containing protein [Pyrinomonadaceae bacterium]
MSALNVMAQKPALISVQSNDVASGSGLSEDPVVSANGRFVAFESFAFNIGPDGNNGRKDIFLRDLQTGITTLVSVNLAGDAGGNQDSQNPAISADGRYVAFESRASNLAANDTNTFSDIFVRDMQTGVTTLVSVNSTGTGSGNEESIKPTISANGRVVLFQTLASNLSSIDTNNTLDVFARDLQTGTMHLVSCNAGCTASGNNFSVTANVPKDKAPRANISNDGRIVVFESHATNLVTIPMAANGFTEVFARDLQTGTTTLLSVNMQGTLSVGGEVPVISGDGRYAVFQSSAPNITANDSGGGFDLFRRDLQTGVTAMVTTTITNTGSAGPSNFGYFPVVSTDGRYITFQSNAKGYVANDLNNGYDAFRRDMQTNTTVLISGITSGGTGVSNDALGAVMSSDGRYVAFIGFGNDFVSTPDTNGISDVYLRDVNAGTTTLLSMNLAGTAAANFGGDYPVISADGRFTFFESGATDMVANTVAGTNIFGVANQGRAQFSTTGFTVSETLSNATFGITRTGNTSGPLTIQYATSNGSATAGADYSTAAGSITFADGETTKNIVIQFNDDALDEFDENVLLTLSDFNATGDAAGSLHAAVLTLTDDDLPPSISIADATLVEGSSGSTLGTVTLTLSAASGKQISLGLSSTPGTAAQNTDYNFFATLTNIPAGATSHTVQFQIIGDTTLEDDETFTVTLSNPTNVTIARATATITIQNDDPVPGITINDVTLAETNSGTRSFSFSVRLSNPSTRQISLQFATANGSAGAGSDYTAVSGPLTFFPSQTLRTVTVLVNGDPVVEPDENFVVNLSNPTNATLVDSQGVGTIQNDDLPPVLVLEENTQRAVALELTSWLRDPFTLSRDFNFGPDPRTRISIFALNLALIAGEDATAVTVSAEDNTGFVHSLQVESVSVVANDPTLSQIIVRLPDGVVPPGELKLKVTLRGQTSNVGVVRITSP